MTNPGTTSRAPAWTAGILGHASGLVTALHTAFVVLVVASAVRYLSGHGFGDQAPWVLGGAVVLLATYAAHRLLPSRLWLALLVAVWFGLVLVAPSFAWCAVPLSFVALRVLPFWPACAVVAGMVATTVVTWTRMTDRLDPTIVLGPVCVAVLAVGAYRALERDALARQALLDDLHAAQGDLADAQHRAGVLAERARLSREIHDSVAQGLSSINLLLQAAEHEWDDRPAAAREHAAQAAATARDGLDEVRRVVRDLAPAELASGPGSLRCQVRCGRPVSGSPRTRVWRSASRCTGLRCRSARRSRPRCYGLRAVHWLMCWSMQLRAQPW